MSALSVRNLSVSYYGKKAISDVSFQIAGGHLVGLIGPNGAGKSTLIKAILGLIPHEQGEVAIAGQPIKMMRKKIAYVPQRSSVDWNFPIVVKDTVLLGTYPHLGLFHRPTKADKEWALACLEQVGLSEFQNNQIGELSGGQQQRVFLARALAQRAEYFFLDEPFAGIDAASEQVIITILKKLRDEGKTVFVVHHDLNKVEQYFDQLIVINNKLIGSGSVDEVFQAEVVQKAFQTPFSRFGQLGVGV